MLLRDVQPGDVDAYVKMRCDPVMTAELGGPQPRDGIEGKVARDVADAAAGTALIKMIIPDQAAPMTVAGSVALWAHDSGGRSLSEIGWMVLPAPTTASGTALRSPRWRPGRSTCATSLQSHRGRRRRGLLPARPHPRRFRR